jgi:hypothetical protein
MSRPSRAPQSLRCWPPCKQRWRWRSISIQFPRACVESSKECSTLLRSGTLVATPPGEYSDSNQPPIQLLPLPPTDSCSPPRPLGVVKDSDAVQNSAGVDDSAEKTRDSTSSHSPINQGSKLTVPVSMLPTKSPSLERQMAPTGEAPRTAGEPSDRQRSV